MGALKPLLQLAAMFLVPFSIFCITMDIDPVEYIIEHNNPEYTQKAKAESDVKSQAQFEVQKNRGISEEKLASSSLSSEEYNDYRFSHMDEYFPSGNETGPAAGYYIKGNISSSGERIYHMPGDRYYDATVIDTRKGERWFSCPEEAEAAGWRRAYV